MHGSQCGNLSKMLEFCAWVVYWIQPPLPKSVNHPLNNPYPQWRFSQLGCKINQIFLSPQLNNCKIYDFVTLWLKCYQCLAYMGYLMVHIMLIWYVQDRIVKKKKIDVQYLTTLMDIIITLLYHSSSNSILPRCKRKWVHMHICKL